MRHSVSTYASILAGSIKITYVTVILLNNVTLDIFKDPTYFLIDEIPNPFELTQQQDNLIKLSK